MTAVMAAVVMRHGRARLTVGLSLPRQLQEHARSSTPFATLRGAPGPLRGAPRFGARWTSTSADSEILAPLRKSLLRRFLTVCAMGVVFTSTGFLLASWSAFDAANRMITPPADSETNSMFTPTDEQTAKIDEFLRNHPVAQELRNDPEYIESRPHMKITPEMRSHSLTAGTLLGPGKIWVPPIAFVRKGGGEILILAYLGRDLSGHPGVVHGGCMATLLDEGLARCCFSQLPHKIGMTANLSINYKAPLPTDSYICLRGTTTKVDGRKAWVEGRLEGLVEPGQTPTVHCTATALFIEPRQTAAMARLYGSAAS